MAHLQYKKFLYISVLLAAVVFSLTTLLTCNSKSTKAEDEIIALIDHVENLMEEHQGRKVKQLIATTYSDERKRQKKDLEQLITYYLLRYQKIHILKQVTDITFTNSTSCSTTVFAAMAGTGGELKTMLESLQTDVYKFHFLLDKSNGDWSLTSADWQKASAEDIKAIWGSLSPN